MGTPDSTEQLYSAINRVLHIGGPCAVFASLFASCTRSALPKMENEASSETASARAVVSPRRKTNSTNKRPVALTEKYRWRFSILAFMINISDGKCQMVANFLDHRNRVSS